MQNDLEAEQVKVNSLTHMVVIVDENSGESATAVLEDQLQVRTQKRRVIPRPLWSQTQFHVGLILHVLSHCLFRRGEEPTLGCTSQLGFPSL